MNNFNNSKKQANRQRKTTLQNKKTLTQAKKPRKKLTRAQYDDLRQIEWVPFDPFAD